MSARRSPPKHVVALRKRIENAVDGNQAGANLTLRTVAMIAIAQMLPPSAVKGGTAMRLRMGMARSRFRRDLDLARREGLETFLSKFQSLLRAGWGGFSGEIRPNAARARPRGVPSHYIMESRDIKVAYAGKSLTTLVLEVAHDELDDTLDPPTVLSDDIPALFETLGLPDPAPVPVVAHDHQIAQKLHAVSEPGGERAHDMVDLQLLEATCPSVDQRVGELARRLFEFRRAHAWPPRVELGSGWETLYAAEADGLDVLPDASAAVAWTNAYIERLDSALESP